MIQIQHITIGSLEDIDPFQSQNATDHYVGPLGRSLAHIDQLFSTGNPDNTDIRTLADIRKLLRADGIEVNVYRAREGYYYFTCESLQPSSGVYVFSCKGTTYGFWLREIREYMEVK